MVPVYIFCFCRHGPQYILPFLVAFADNTAPNFTLCYIFDVFLVFIYNVKKGKKNGAGTACEYILKVTNWWDCNFWIFAKECWKATMEELLDLHLFRDDRECIVDLVMRFEKSLDPNLNIY